MSESKIKKFALGTGKAITNVTGATIRGTATAIGGVIKGVGTVIGSITDVAEQLADIPKGSAKKIHNTALAIMKHMKASKLAANAGKMSTAFHAGRAALSGVVSVIIESVALVDSILVDNALLNKLEKKFAELKGDTSKFKKWFKEHDRLGAYTAYYGVITMVLAFMWDAGLANQFGKGDETLTKKSKAIIQKLEKEVKDSEVGKKFIGPWIEDKKTTPKMNREEMLLKERLGRDF